MRFLLIILFLMLLSCEKKEAIAYYALLEKRDSTKTQQPVPETAKKIVLRTRQKISDSSGSKWYSVIEINEYTYLVITTSSGVAVTPTAETLIKIRNTVDR